MFQGAKNVRVSLSVIVLLLALKANCYDILTAISTDADFLGAYLRFNYSFVYVFVCQLHPAASLSKIKGCGIILIIPQVT